MKLARVEDVHGRIGIGVVANDGKAVEWVKGSIFDAPVKTGESSMIKRFLSPVDPPNVIAIGLNYRDHAIESGMAIPELPLVFLKLTTTVVGAGDAIVLPKVAPNEVDYEAELVVVIGKTCRNVSKEDATKYILGYTCGNDVSARDCQLKIDKQWARGKSFDTFCPLGPWIVTSDEIDPSDLRIRTTINGSTVQDSRTNQLIFDVPTLVSFLSQQCTMPAGTVIMTGTPPGVGFSKKPALYLHAGDSITVDIEGIGSLTNPVIAEK